MMGDIPSTDIGWWGLTAPPAPKKKKTKE